MLYPSTFDAAVARAVAGRSDRTVRVGASGVIAGVGLGLCGLLLVQISQGFPSLLGLGFGGVFPLVLAVSVAIGGLLLFLSGLDAEQSAHVGIWWAIGTVVAGTTGVAIIVLEWRNGVLLMDPQIIVAGNAATGGLGGMIVGWYDARRLAVAAERERERQRLADEREKLALVNRIVRHDIGNDLQVVAGMGDVLERYVDEDGQEALERLQRTTEEAIDLTERIRGFVSMIEEQEETVHPVAVHRIVHTQVDTARQRHPEAILEIDGNVPDVTVRADELLATVLHNLISNAIAHNDTPEPHVIVSVEADSDVVRLRVADNGPGIPEDRRGSLFDRDEFGSQSEGTGIGLYIVDMLVERYSGTVWVEDRDDTRGSVFVVELPRVAEENPDETTAE